MSELTHDEEFSGVLDLSDADTSGFDAMDPGKQPALVWEATWGKTKEDSTGAMGPNVPFINVQFKIDTGEGVKYNNRRVFNKYFPKPPEGYDADKAAKLKGSFVNFLVALGYDEAAIKAPGFTLDLSELNGKECDVVVSKQEYPKGSGIYTNGVAGVKARSAAGAPGEGTGII